MRIGAVMLVGALALAGCAGFPGTGERKGPAEEGEGVTAKPGHETASEAALEEFSEEPWEEARARGAEIRAIGQEPGWWLEIRRDGSIMLASDYGTRRQVFERPRSRYPEEGVELFQPVGTGVLITVEERACSDIMSGQQMPLTVAVETPDEELKGCGRRLLQPSD